MRSARAVHTCSAHVQRLQGWPFGAKVHAVLDGGCNFRQRATLTSTGPHPLQAVELELRQARTQAAAVGNLRVELEAARRARRAAEEDATCARAELAAARAEGAASGATSDSAAAAAGAALVRRAEQAEGALAAARQRQQAEG